MADDSDTKEQPTYVVIGATYPNLSEALADFDNIKELRTEGSLKDVNAALIRKDSKGRVHVHETTRAGRNAAGAGATVGIVGGAIVGAIFPPAGAAIIAGALVGGVGVGGVAGLIGHFAGGLSRKDLKEVGSVLDDDEAAIIAVGVEAAADRLDTALAKATKKSHAALNSADIQAAVADIEQGIDQYDNAAN